MLDGSVLMGDYWNMRVQRAILDPDGSIASIDPNFIANPGFQAGQHQAPYGLGVDPVSGNIYMADTDRYGVDVYDPYGNFILEWGMQGDGVEQVPLPLAGGRALRRPGVRGRHLGEPDRRGRRRTRRRSTCTELGTFGTFGTGAGCKMKQPHGMAWWYGPDGTDSIADDRLFVVDANNKQIDVFGSDPTASVYGPGCNWLYSIRPGRPGPRRVHGRPARDRDRPDDPESPTGAAVYVVDAAGNRIRKFSPTGHWLRTFGVTATNPTAPEAGAFSDGGREITVDAHHRVWVGDMPGFRFQVFDGLTGQSSRDPRVPGRHTRRPRPAGSTDPAAWRSTPRATGSSPTPTTSGS